MFLKTKKRPVRHEPIKRTATVAPTFLNSGTLRYPSPSKQRSITSTSLRTHSGVNDLLSPSTSKADSQTASTKQSSGRSLVTTVSESHSSVPLNAGSAKKLNSLSGVTGPRSRGSLDYWIRPEIVLKPYQEEGVKWLKNKKGAILGDEMGLGKTIQALFTFGMHIWAAVKKDPDKRCVMVAVVPASLRMNWADEIEKFTKLEYCVVSGSGVLERFKQIEEFKRIDNHKILVLNYEILGDHIQQLNSMNVDFICADEAHVIKNKETNAYKNISQIAAGRRLAMTGTPMTNQVDDLWTLLDWVTPGQWGTFAGFKAKYCVLGGFNGKQVTAVKNERQLNSRLSQVMLRREIDSVIDLPEVNVVKRMVSLVDKPREMYNYLATEHKLQKYVPTMTEEQEEALEWPMVRQLRMRQICSSTCTLVPSWDESPKLDLAIEDACEILDNGHKLIVFTQFMPVVHAYKRRLEAARPGTKVFEIHGKVNKDKRVPITKEWSSVEGPAVMIGIIKAMGVGLNMTAANHCQFVGKEFSPGLNDQCIGRLRRVGSEHHSSITVLDYMVRNSAEYRVEQIIKDKEFSFDAVIRNGSKGSAGSSFMEKLNEALEGTL